MLWPSGVKYNRVKGSNNERSVATLKDITSYWTNLDVSQFISYFCASGIN